MKQSQTSASGLTFWIVLILCFTALLFCVMSPRLNLYDEGLVLYGSTNVLHGHLPYRDFWTMYGPGQFFLYALVFKLFGVYAIWGRLLFLFTMLVTTCATVHFSKVISGNTTLGVAAGVIAVLWATATLGYTYPVYEALALIFLGLICLLEHWRRGKKIWLFATGVFLALTLFFRHDLALYTAVAFVAGEITSHLQGPNRGRERRELFLDLGLLFLAFAASALPALIFLLSNIPISDIRFQLFYLPSHVYPKVRHLPLLPMDSLFNRPRHPINFLMRSIVFLPAIITLAGLGRLIQEFRTRYLEPWRVSALVSVLLLTVLIPISSFVRPDFYHLAPMVVLCVVPLSCLLGLRSSASPLIRVVTLIAAAFLLLGSEEPLSRALHQTRATVHAMTRPKSPDSYSDMCHPAEGLERAKCVSVDPQEISEVQFIEQHTRPDEELFSADGRHDKLFLNDMILYFLSGRDAATKWYELHPGLQTTSPIQSQIVQDLDRKHVVYIVVRSSWDRIVENNDSGVSSGVTLLDTYIRSHYGRAVALPPDVVILKRTAPF